MNSVARFRAHLQHSALSNYVRQLAKTQYTFDKPTISDRSVRRLTPPIITRDLRNVPDLYFASASNSLSEAPGGRLRSVCGQGDLRTAGIQDQTAAELWIAGTVQTGQVTSSEEDQTSKDDTEDELSK